MIRLLIYAVLVDITWFYIFGVLSSVWRFLNWVVLNILDWTGWMAHWDREFGFANDVMNKMFDVHDPFS